MAVAGPAQAEAQAPRRHAGGNKKDQGAQDAHGGKAGGGPVGVTRPTSAGARREDHRATPMRRGQDRFWRNPVPVSRVYYTYDSCREDDPRQNFDERAGKVKRAERKRSSLRHSVESAVRV